MAYEPLHHKYRPQTFADLVGQEAIATTLSNALTSQRIAPAYLFSGPRGTGKTSSARILAKSLNCLSSDRPTPNPCGRCEVCRGIARGTALDVIEIDAASNTGVDNIREIIERAQFVPVQCRYKVYVIDECHMLSQAAFNALLKTLEEPPGHVIFILATTDPQRVLPTIISRCQRFDYRRIPLEAMVGHLSEIAQKEGIGITEDATTLIGQLANGGLRDAESLLDQLSLLSGTVTPDRVWDLVGAVPEKELLELLQAIRGRRTQAIIEQCRRLLDRGREPLILLQNLAGAYLNLLLAKTAPARSDLAAVSAPTWAELCQEARLWNVSEILLGQQHLRESEVQIKNTTQPRLWLEVTLMGLLNLEIRSQESEGRSHEAEVVSQNSSQNIKDIKQDSDITNKDHQEKADLSETSETTGDSELEQIWETVLQRLSLLTQALIRSHCYLLSLDENAAHIGIKTEPLLKHARTKVEELEQAFQNVLKRPVSVRIKVAAPANLLLETEATENTEISSQEPENIIIPPSPHASVAASPAVASTADTPTVPLPSLPEEESVAEVRKAAESLAKFFEGEIIDLNHQMNGTSTVRNIENSAFTSMPAANSVSQIESRQQKDISGKCSLESLEISHQVAGKVIIQGRPDLSEIDEKDDIPF